MANKSYVTTEMLINTTTKALDGQDKYNEAKYLQKKDATTMLRFKGTVKDFESLPITGNAVGDVYNIQTYTTATDINGDTVYAGDNVAYVTLEGGTAGWDALGGSIDLSDYATKDDLTDAVGGAAGTISDYQINAAVAAANPDIKINFYGDAAKAVTMINADTEEGGAATGYTNLTAAALSDDKTKLTLTAETVAEGYPSEFALNVAGTTATGTGESKTITLNYKTGEVEVN